MTDVQQDPNAQGQQEAPQQGDTVASAPQTPTATFAKGDTVHEAEARIGSGGVQRTGVVLATHAADDNNPEAVTIGWYETERVDVDTLKSGAAADANDDDQ